MKLPALALLALVLTGPAALACDADALGTSRVLAVGTEGGGAVGLKSYPRTLALEPGEVVLTFDDGPLPGRTDKVLDALKAECAHATFFMLGRNAAAAPALAARVAREGHTVAHHSMTHPVMRRLGVEAGKADMLAGFEAVEKATTGSAGFPLRTPFFRFPGFAARPELESWLADRDIVVFGADAWAGDWRPQTSIAELATVMGRLKRTQGGILLLHDTQPQTVAMVPALLRALKQNGYRLVHIVPGPGPLETRPAPGGWHSEIEGILKSLGY